MHNSEIINKLSPRTPLEIISRFIDQKETNTITVYTSDGFTFCGIAIALGEHRGESILSMHLIADSLKGLSDDLVYIHGQRISHIKIHEFRSVAKTLSFGTIARNPGEQAPTKLQLQRDIEEINLRFVKSSGLKLILNLDWDKLPRSDVAFLNLIDLVKALFISLEKLTTDSLGREALQSLTNINIESKRGSPLTMNREKTIMIVQMDLEAAFPEGLGDVILKAVEKTL